LSNFIDIIKLDKHVEADTDVSVRIISLAVEFYPHLKGEKHLY